MFESLKYLKIKYFNSKSKTASFVKMCPKNISFSPLAFSLFDGVTHVLLVSCTKSSNALD